MMACSGDGLQIRLISSAYEKAHVTPAFIVIETIERMAGRYARFAARAGVEINFKCILLARIRLGERNEMREAIVDGFTFIFV